jgi:O-antigen/teichoic acid export membrane protein
MTDKRLQVRNSIIYFMPVIAGTLVALITLPIFTRVLTKEDYGVLALAQVYAVFMSGLINFGLTVGYARNFFEYKDEKRTSQLLYSTLAFVFTSYTVFIFLTYLFKATLAGWIIGSAEHQSLLFWAFCSTSLMSFKVYYLTYFKNTENAKAFVWYTVDETILGILLSLVFVVYFRIGVIGLVYGQLLAALVVFCALACRFLKMLPPSFSWPVLKDSLALSYPLTPRIFLGVIGSQFDKYMIGLMGTTGGVGVYSIGQSISYSVFTFMTAIQNVFSPQVYKRMFDSQERGGEEIGKYLTPFIYICIAFGLLISLFSEEIIFILTPQSYQGAADIIIVLSMLYGSYFFGKQPQLIFAKKTFMTSILTLVSIMVNVAVNIPFILKWGAIGAAWGALTAGVISGTISFIISQKYYRIFWEYKKIWVIFLIFFGASIGVFLLRQTMIAYELRLVFKGVALIGYVYFGIVIGVVTRSNLLMVLRLLPLKRFQDVKS